MENRKPTFRLKGEHQQSMEKEELYDVKILKNRSYSANQEDIICLCLQGPMSRCSQVGVWDKQSICFFSEESMTGPRCMYWIESIDCHCDCMEAQKYSKGQFVDLKKFRKDKIRRLILGNKEIWDEPKILGQIKSIMADKISKYKNVDIPTLQSRYNDGKLSGVGHLFDQEWEVFYTGGGTFIEGDTRKFTEGQIRSAHDIEHMVNLLVKHEELHDKFRYNKKVDDEMSDIMGEYEAHEQNSTKISPDEWRKLEQQGLVSYRHNTSFDNIWFNYDNGHYYVENKLTGWYERAHG
jgi:hypothetical protein